MQKEGFEIAKTIAEWLGVWTEVWVNDDFAVIVVDRDKMFKVIGANGEIVRLLERAFVKPYGVRKLRVVEAADVPEKLVANFFHDIAEKNMMRIDRDGSLLKVYIEQTEIGQAIGRNGYLVGTLRMILDKKWKISAKFFVAGKEMFKEEYFFDYALKKILLDKK
jgi:transcription antitermination factor NusA-like protein